MRKLIVLLPVSLHVAHVVVKATDGQPARASWQHHDRAHKVPLGHLHRLLAADSPLGSAILRGLRDWEQGRVCSEMWVGAGRYKAGEWARLGQMGYTGAEDEGIWAAMVGGEEAVKDEPPPKAKPPPPKPPITKAGDKNTSRWHFESDESSDGAIPPPPPLRERPALPSTPQPQRPPRPPRQTSPKGG